VVAHRHIQRGRIPIYFGELVFGPLYLVSSSFVIVIFCLFQHLVINKNLDLQCTKDLEWPRPVRKSSSPVPLSELLARCKGKGMNAEKNRAHDGAYGGNSITGVRRGGGNGLESIISLTCGPVQFFSLCG